MARSEIVALLDRELVWEGVEDYRDAFKPRAPAAAPEAGAAPGAAAGRGADGPAGRAGRRGARRPRPGSRPDQFARFSQAKQQIEDFEWRAKQMQKGFCRNLKAIVDQGDGAVAELIGEIVRGFSRLIRQASFVLRQGHHDLAGAGAAPVDGRAIGGPAGGL